MPEAVSTYTTRVSGLWNSRHEIRQGDETLGTLQLHRRAVGGIDSASYQPVKGEGFTFRRDPGLLRGQFTMWSGGREWIGSTVRFHPLRRLVEINTGGKPFALAPRPGFGRGWSLYAPKTGEVARISVPLVGRSARIEVFRKTQFPLLLLAYFVGCQAWCESLWPGPPAEKVAVE